MKRCTLFATKQAKQRIEMVKGAYKSKGLELKSEDPNIFGGIFFLWCQSENCFKLRQKFPEKQFGTGNIGMIGQEREHANWFDTGLMIGCFDRVTHRDFIWYWDL